MVCPLSLRSPAVNKTLQLQIWKDSGRPRSKPGTAVWEERTVPQCYAVPPKVFIEQLHLAFFCSAFLILLNPTLLELMALCGLTSTAKLEANLLDIELDLISSSFEAVRCTDKYLKSRQF